MSFLSICMVDVDRESLSASTLYSLYSQRLSGTMPMTLPFVVVRF